MATLFSAVLSQARGLLNDISAAVYTDVAMIPLGDKVYKELQLKVTALGIGTTKEVSSAVDVAAGTVRLGDGAGLPADLLSPIKLFERADGSTNPEDYVPMDEQDWEPTLKPDEMLHYWQWREDEIKFVGATTNREVLIRYYKSLGSISATNSPILILNSVEWQAQRLAAIAALVIGSNPTRAQALNDDLIGIWDDLKAILVKRKQIVPVRRRRTRYRAR